MTKNFIENLDGQVPKMMMQIMRELELSNKVGWRNLRPFMNTIDSLTLVKNSATTRILNKKKELENSILT